ncbi:Bifunctional hemolysin/adenylate cyclase precursor [Roseivivax jejudonensis]|uniref:Bifunctional hemolysin/adenylate cyclase n=1 Tax=Roseivivax jejudonensis TaxID=1529041 RepID=A0A1X6YX60_9RHOB|nr:VCBS domain-containing protein [Roseivivax jejudonensis]SLN33361.1 Bifunctional hemolysin/adenylate cyclase precursor [Roseivivax jejudonensis]
MPNWNQIYNGLFSAPLPAGQTSPGSDNVDFDDFPNVNKAKMGGGNDFADGNDGANVIFGNGGRDYLRGDGGNDSMHGGNGNDALLGDNPNDVPQGNDLLDGGGGNDIVIGAGGNDDITGQNGHDIVIGGDGNDHANGGMGNDFVTGGNGRDTLRGGWNNDQLAGQLGNDSIFGGSGDDVVSGGDGDDTIYGGSQDDTLAGNAGHDFINGGNGHDLILANSGNDVVSGWNGNDSMAGSCGDDAMAGDRGDDLIFGEHGNDYLTGGSGDDSIDGGIHNDIIEGNDNADCLDGGDGDDVIYGDNVPIFNNSDELINPALGEASDLIRGGLGNDTVYGGEDDDQINGNEDNDSLSGDTGNDTISGDQGNDTLDGGDGNDHLSGAAGNDSILGGNQNDVISGGGGSDTVDGENGHDCIAGDAGRDSLDGGNGDDSIDGGAANDTIDGGRGDDLLYGNDGNDLVMGDEGQSGGGDDTLLGGLGNDTLDGGKDNDCIVSGGYGLMPERDDDDLVPLVVEQPMGDGDDEMTGGGDADTFTFGYDLDLNGDGDCDDEGEGALLFHDNDTITDFRPETNQDVIQLHTGLQIKNVAFDGDDLIITTALAENENVETGTIRVEDAALVVSGLDGSDPDFNPSSQALEDFITDYDPETGEGKGFVVFGDKCITLPECTPDTPVTGWEAELPEVERQHKPLSDQVIGDTTINVTQQILAARYVTTDVNVLLDPVPDLDANPRILPMQLILDAPASTPPTLEVSPSTEVIEDIDASAQVIDQEGTVSFDDIDSTDLVTITFEDTGAPVWSDGDLAVIDPTLAQQILDGFDTGVEFAVPPDTIPWTYDLTAALDFLAKDETITWSYIVTAEDCDDGVTTQEITFQITGTNDVPTVAAEQSILFTEDSDASAQTLEEFRLFTHDDLDYNDTLDILIESNEDIAWSGGPLEAGLADRLEDGNGLDGTFLPDQETPDTEIFQYGPVTEDLDFLREGETITWSYTVSVTDPHNASDSDIVDVTVTGTNDQPVAEDLAFTLSEDDSDGDIDGGPGTGFEELTTEPNTYNFEVTDDDVNDTHTFEVLGLTEIAPGVYQTVDNEGFEYGKLYNNGDGTFTFDPEDDFQHLEEGESRTVTFQYQARDDSGVGESPTAPSETELSAPKTVTLTIEGEDDNDLSVGDRLTFITQNQSIWNSGPAFSLEPDLPFLGIDEEFSLNATIIPDIPLTAGVVGDVLEGLADVAEFFAQAGCDVVDFFAGLFGQDDVCGDIDLNVRPITVPGVSTSGNADIKIGVQPYFFLNGGEVDAEIPVDVVFNTPRQVEQGETFTLETAYSVDGGASFVTDGPGVQFGLDFVLDFDANLVLDLFGANVPVFDIDTASLLGTGELGEPGFNIFDVSPGDEFAIPVDGVIVQELLLTNPDFGATGSPVNPANTILEGSDNETLVDLTIDVDGFVSTVTPLPQLGGTGGDGFNVNFGDVGSINVASFEYAWDLLDVDLQGILSAVQDFTLEITQLPMTLLLEDNSTINGVFVGDDISVDVPEGSTFDVDTDGDMDGMLDILDISVDMEALFEHVSSLELDMNLILGVLRFTAGVTSDFFPDVQFSLFDGGNVPGGLIPTLPFDPMPNDGFLLGGTIPLIEDATLATLFNDQFPLEGWNTEQTGFEFDVA